MTKSKTQIILGNTFTLFNLLNFMIALLLLSVKAYSNMMFIGIIIINILIGIGQELKAKKLVDELSILNRPHVVIRKDGKDCSVEMDQVAVGDLMVLKSGDQICNDGVIESGALEVNESLLTGESDGIIKEKGGSLYSGSFVISGKALAKVIHTGNENYASKLAMEVKKEKTVHSELIDSIRKVTRCTSFLILPLGVLLLCQAFILRNTPVNGAVVSVSAALLGMLPKGLVLLISVSLAAGIIRLAKMKILVQNIYSLETLAHVDTICLDKTGTLTDGKLKVQKVIPMSDLPEKEVLQMVQAYLAACEDNNATFLALKEHFTEKPWRRPEKIIPFSSKRKWGSISFKDNKTVFLGAPEKLLQYLPGKLEKELEYGNRIVIIGFLNGQWDWDYKLPEKIEPLCAIVLEDQIRRNVRKTLEFFYKEGVDIKVISGDHIKTVSAIAKKAGLSRWQSGIDLSTAGDIPDYDTICEQYSIFARVTPKQKQELVKALQRKGHKVAMTGDGVNDLLALREADCSIAVADGSDASRQIAQVVLLDSDFTHLPQVVMEGRRVIHNITRTAGVFFIKTIYSVLVSLLCLAANIPFPFIPIQITLIDAFVEAYPSFVTIIESDTSRVQGKFLKTAFLHAMPFGLTAAGMMAVISISAPFDEAGRQTVMYLLLIAISIAAVIKSSIPFHWIRVLICVTMVMGLGGSLVILPSLFQISPLTGDIVSYLFKGLGISMIFVLFLCKCCAMIEKRESLQSVLEGSQEN